MKKQSMSRTLSTAIGTAFVAGAALSPIAQAADNPFGMQKLDSGYQLAQAKADDKKKDGKCGEGKCGAEATKAKADAKMKDGSCGGDKVKMKDGSCGAKK